MNTTTRPYDHAREAAPTAVLLSPVEAKAAAAILRAVGPSHPHRHAADELLARLTAQGVK
jgi:hypothetical protein